MKIPLLFCLFMLFVLWYALQRSKIAKKESEQSNQFWEKEDLANSTRKQDLSQLAYICVLPNDFPLLTTKDSQLNAYHEELCILSQQPIVNLTGVSNTELKLLYGAANLPSLIQYDQNFTQLIQLLVKWATRLREFNYLQEAITVLELGVAYQTDISLNFTLLATLYGETGNQDKILDLISKTDHISNLKKETLIKKLEDILDSFSAA